LKILAIDITSNYSSMAYLNGDEINSVVIEHDLKERPNWDDLFLGLGKEKTDILNSLSALAYANGPGSYTALRSAASFLKGLAYSQQFPIIPISSLESQAWEGKHWIKHLPAKIGSALDADGQGYYFNIYDVGFESIKRLQEDAIITLDELKSYAKDEDDCYFIGDVWEQCSISEAKRLMNATSSAESVASIAKMRLDSGMTFQLDEIDPVYLKDLEFKKIT